MSDALTTGRALRLLTVLDDASRECLELYAETSIPAEKVVEKLDAIATFRGYPRVVRTDGGPEFQSRTFALWCAKHGVKHFTIAPGKPQQNAYIEAFNGLARDGFLNENLFATVRNAQEKAAAWKKEYNLERPHGVLGVPPALFARKLRKLRLMEKTLIQTGTK